MHLECVTVCVNYADFLAVTLPRNKIHFDQFIIVTTRADLDTQAVCAENGVTCVFTDRLYENEGDKFNKGKAINDGFKNLKFNDWVVHTDADMVFAVETRKVIEAHKLETDTFYGSGRILCPGYAAWQSYMKTGRGPRRWPRQRKGRNIGVGFFQMFNVAAPPLAGPGPWYPEEFGHAGRSDRFFLRKWAKRDQLPLLPIHLEAEWGTPLGANWTGRKTPKFGSVDPVPNNPT